MKKLAICYPWDSPFMFSVGVESMLNIKAPEGVKIQWIRGLGWCSSRRHIDCLEKAIKWGADYICILGSDQIYQEDIILRLVERVKEGYKIISALIPTRGHVSGQGTHPFQFMAWRRNKETKEFEIIDNDEAEVQEIDLIGSAVFMFPTEILSNLKKPWFSHDIVGEGYKLQQSCDVRFIWRLKVEAKAKIYVDTTIKVKHAHVFEIDESFQDRFKDWGN